MLTSSPLPQLSCLHATTASDNISNDSCGEGLWLGNEALGSHCEYLRWSFAGLGNLGDGECRCV